MGNLRDDKVWGVTEMYAMVVMKQIKKLRSQNVDKVSHGHSDLSQEDNEDEV
jgi:hypothetical protein